MALAARVHGSGSRTFTLLGDGECQEGSVWEAAFVAARYGLDGLVVIVDHNRLQQFGWQGDSSEHRLPPQAPGELAGKWAAFGWRVIEIDGHAMGEVVGALRTATDEPDGRPVAIIASTIKGRGLSFAEGEYLWHVKIPTDEEYALALAELGEPADGGARSVAEAGR
jgi:transketolase